jgi:type VI secretion system secreted protein Hcp
LENALVKKMERSKPVGKALELSGRRLLAGLMVSLIVVGGAISVGSALGKGSQSGEGNHGEAHDDAADTSSSSEHGGGKPGAGNNTSAAPPANTTKFAYHLDFVGTSADQNMSFEIKDWSFGVENPTTIGSATGGAGAGKIQFNELTIKKTVDSFTPLLFKNCATGSHYKTVTLDLRKVNSTNASDSTVFMRFQFGTVFTTKIDWSGPGDEGPEESITFVYGQLTVEYKAQNSTNSTLVGWDQIQNKVWDGSAF